jgi:hypothetical protein
MLRKGMLVIFHTSQGMGNLPHDYYPYGLESVMCLFELKKNQSDRTKGSQRVETSTKIFVNIDSFFLRIRNDGKNRMVMGLEIIVQ